VKMTFYHDIRLGVAVLRVILRPEQPLRPTVRLSLTESRTPSRSRKCHLLSRIGGNESNPRTVLPFSPGHPSHKPWPHWGLWKSSERSVRSGLPHRLTSPVSRCRTWTIQTDGEG